MQQVKHQVIIERPNDVIYEYLSRPQNYVELQPFIINAGNIKAVQLPDGKAAYDYHAEERLSILGIISFKIRLPVHMILEAPNERITNQTQTAFNVSVSQMLSLSRIAPDRTLVINNIIYKAPFWIRGYVHKQIVYAHSYFVQKLKAIMEGEDV
jgi:hypothetical protein